jgi:hypothetical protein
MKKTELKKILKPLVKECVREAIYEDGILSNVISEVVKGLRTTQQQAIVEHKRDDENQMKKLQLEEKQKRSERIQETRRKMLDAINKDAYNGVDLFEGTVPLRKSGDPNDDSSPQGPLSGVDPGDSGVDISHLMGNKNVWKAIADGGNK